MKIFFLIALTLLISCNGVKNGKYCKDEGNQTLKCEIYSKGVLQKIYTLNAQDTNIRNGPIIELSIGGDTLVKGYYKNNQLIGGYYEYYRSNYPKKYICFDSFKEDTMFYREYDINGKIVKEKGEVLYGKGYTGINTNQLTVDSTLEVLSVLIAPPKSKTVVSCFIIRLNSISTDTIKPLKGYYEPKQNNLLYTTVFKITIPGDYKIFTVTDFHDSLNERILRKSESYSFQF